MQWHKILTTLILSTPPALLIAFSLTLRSFPSFKKWFTKIPMYVIFFLFLDFALKSLQYKFDIHTTYTHIANLHLSSYSLTTFTRSLSNSWRTRTHNAPIAGLQTESKTLGTQIGVSEYSKITKTFFKWREKGSWSEGASDTSFHRT